MDNVEAYRQLYSQYPSLWNRVNWYSGYNGYIEVDYVLKTGATWEGPIKQFKLVIHDKNRFAVASIAGKPTYQDGAIVVTRTNYVPRDNLKVMFFEKSNYVHLDYNMDNPYRPLPSPPVGPTYLPSFEDILAHLYRGGEIHLVGGSREVTDYLTTLKPRKLQILRNAIFAGKGYRFKTKWLGKYFQSHFPEYRGTKNSVALRPWEKQNVALLLRLQESEEKGRTR